MLKDLNIVCLAGCEWTFTWQPTQEIMLRLAKAGNRVLYIQPTGTRTVRLSDWRRIWERLKEKVVKTERVSALPDTLTIYSPIILPFPYSRFARWINRRILRRQVKRWSGGRETRDWIYWFYFSSPLNAELMQEACGALTIYQIMTSAEAVRPNPEFIKANDSMLQRADLVFANSGRLRVQAGLHNPHSYLFRAGVSLEVFDNGSETGVPEELRDVDGPLVGYVGALHEWVDMNLLHAVATAMPEVAFVFVGPIMRDVTKLRELQNVRFLGQRSHGELSKYVQTFNVCVIPYVRDAYTETTYPAKLNEYLALGKPVVATPLPELEDYNREFGGVLRLAGNAAAFVTALRESINDDTPGRREMYQRVARQNAWTAILDSMSSLIEHRMQTKCQAGRPS